MKFADLSDDARDTAEELLSSVTDTLDELEDDEKQVVGKHIVRKLKSYLAEAAEDLEDEDEDEEEDEDDE